MDPAHEAVDGTHVVLDEKSPLSASMLWDLQRSYFDATGASAWTTGGVPHYVTTNPFIARAYARCVHAFMNDLWATQPPTGALRSLTASSPTS